MDDLTYISLYYWCTALTDKALPWIAQRCPQLKKFNFSGCNKVTDVGISVIAKKFNKKLKRLDFGGCNKVTEGILHVLIVIHCTGLENLIAYLQHLISSGIPSVLNKIRNLQQLQYLNLSGNQIMELPHSIITLKDTCEE